MSLHLEVELRYFDWTKLEFNSFESEFVRN